MKNFKKFTAAVAATLMAATMVAPMAMNFATSAADSLTLTLENPVTDPASTIKNVNAYKIFNTTNDNDVLMITGWGMADATALVNAIKADATLGLAADNELATTAAGASHFSGVLTEWNTAANANVTAPTKPEDYDSNEEATTAYDTAKAKYDADKAAKDAANAKIETFAKIAAKTLTVGTEGAWAEDKVTFTDGLADGYYVITCDVVATNTKTEGEGDETVEKTTSKSLGMLTVIDGEAQIVGLNGEAKVSLPQVEKKVGENTKDVTGVPKNETDKDNEDKWNDAADYNVGDAVPFKLYGTMPENLEKYDTYFYKFTDSLSTNFDKPTSLTIKVDNAGTENDITYTATYTAPSEGVTGGWTVEGATGVAVENTEAGFTVAFTDIKGNQKADASTLVTIKYTAVLNENAVVGKDGQDNAVYLTYSNNPNNSGSGETGDTPDDKVRVYTYGFEVEKQFFAAGSNSPVTKEEVETAVFEKVIFNVYSVDAEGNKTKLKFKKLGTNTEGFDYVLVKDYDEDTEDKKLATTWNRNSDDAVETGDIVEDLKLRSTIDGKDDDGDDIHKYVIKIKGLDDGDYVLEEAVAPDGYTQADNKEFSIKAETVNDQDWDMTDENQPLKNFDEDLDGKLDETVGDNDVVTYEYYDGVAQTIVENRKGSSLPSTGGIGTTLFYVGGGAMVALAGIFLITKKRMNKNEA